MANENAPFGFRPLYRAGGAPFTPTLYAKAADDSQAIFMFDLVTKAATAVALSERADIYATGIAGGYGATMNSAVWLGAVLNYGAASTASYHLVVNHVDMVFLAQGKTGTTYSTASHVGKNADADKATAGSTVTKQSGMAIDGATINTTNTLGLRLIRISTISPNAEGANAIFEVSINRHHFANQVAGV